MVKTKYREYQIFYQLGIHLGHLIDETYYLNNIYLSGKVNQVDVIDIKQTIYYLKNTAFFLEECGYNNAKLLFYSSDNYLYEETQQMYLISLINLKNKQALIDERWSYGMLSNFRVQAIQELERMFFIFKNKKLVKKGDYQFLNYFDWITLFLRVLFYTHHKRIPGSIWSDHIYLISRYWRLYILFKFFKSFMILPDVFVMVNPSNIPYPLVEAKSLNIPVVGLLDSNSYREHYSYFVTSNDDSVLISFFYFQLFLNYYNLGKLKSYKGLL